MSAHLYLQDCMLYVVEVEKDVLTSFAAVYFKSHGVSSIASVGVHSDEASYDGWTERTGFNCSF